METAHGWIVGVSVIDTDSDPTTFTRKGAEDLANRLNADQLVTFERWTIEPSKEGIPLVFGDGKYPQDPPRVASELESALAGALDVSRDDGRTLAAFVRFLLNETTPPASVADALARVG